MRVRAVQCSARGDSEYFIMRLVPRLTPDPRWDGSISSAFEVLFGHPPPRREGAVCSHSAPVAALRMLHSRSISFNAREMTGRTGERNGGLLDGRTDREPSHARSPGYCRLGSKFVKAVSARGRVMKRIKKLTGLRLSYSGQKSL